MKHSEAVKLLFLGWQSQADSLKPEAAGLYLRTAASFAECDVTTAVHDFTQGRVADHDKRWLPSSAAFGEHCKRVRNQRLDEEARNNPRLPPPAPPPARTPLEIERARQLVRQFKATKPELYISPAEHEAAKQRIIKEALAADTSALILRIAEGDETALAEWNRQNAEQGLTKRERTAA